MGKITLPMVSMTLKDVQNRIETLEACKKRLEENRLRGEHDILRARVMVAEQALISSTIIFFSYLEESKIKFWYILKILGGKIY